MDGHALQPDATAAMRVQQPAHLCRRSGADRVPERQLRAARIEQRAAGLDHGARVRRTIIWIGDDH